MPERDISRALRLCAYLLRYPEDGMRANLPALRDALRQEPALSRARQSELDRLAASLLAGDSFGVESAYIELFDRSRATSLHLFEHVHGESRDRGPAMVALNQTYAEAGLHLAPGELPDYLPVVLEFASTQPPAAAKAFLGELSHLLNALFNALERRQSPYAAVLGALLELAGEKAKAVDVPVDEPIDAAWEEPPVFGGCSSKGQAKPQSSPTPQPINLVRAAKRAGVSA
jgi:nitrate reductase delta subunit